MSLGEKKKKEIKQLPYLCSLSTAEKWCGIYFLDCFSALSTKQDKMLFTFPLVVLRTGMRMEDRTQRQLLCSIVPSSFAVTTYNQIQRGFLLNQMHLCYFITFCEESASSAGENYWSNSPQGWPKVVTSTSQTLCSILLLVLLYTQKPWICPSHRHGYPTHYEEENSASFR